MTKDVSNGMSRIIEQFTILRYGVAFFLPAQLSPVEAATAVPSLCTPCSSSDCVILARDFQIIDRIRYNEFLYRNV